MTYMYMRCYMCVVYMCMRDISRALALCVYMYVMHVYISVFVVYVRYVCRSLCMCVYRIHASAICAHVKCSRFFCTLCFVHLHVLDMFLAQFVDQSRCHTHFACRT